MWPPSSDPNRDSDECHVLDSRLSGVHASRLHPAISPTTRFDGRYDLLAYLGGGRFGEVWKALDTTTGRTVALKLIDPVHTAPDDAWQEATLLTSLASPNGPSAPFLVSVHGASLSGLGVPYIDMALAGGSVEGLCSPFGVDEATAVRWTQRVARGLQLVHDRRLIHRDVKPDNVLLSHTGDALLGDFGATAVMAADGTAGEHGDVHVRAPEAFGGVCSAPGDIYSLGVCLFYFVVGSYPYAFSDYGCIVPSFAAAVRSGLPDVREAAPHLSLSIARIINKATDVDPRSRYKSASEFDTALAEHRPPSRAIRRVCECAGAERCWDAIPGARESLSTIHVCCRRASHNSFEIETRHAGGRRNSAQCATVSARQLSARLRKVFRSLH